MILPTCQTMAAVPLELMDAEPLSVVANKRNQLIRPTATISLVLSLATVLIAVGFFAFKAWKSTETQQELLTETEKEDRQKWSNMMTMVAVGSGVFVIASAIALFLSREVYKKSAGDIII